MNMEADDLLVDYPVGATLLVAAVATVAYVAMQLVLDGSVDPLETAVFVLVFTVVYVSGNWYLRRRDRDENGNANAANGSGSDEPSRKSSE